LGYEVARGTIANILKEHALEPAPERERKSTWKEFLCRHREVIGGGGLLQHRGLDAQRFDEIPGALSQRLRGIREEVEHALVRSRTQPQ
jgi:hypothetical protein